MRTLRKWLIALLIVTFPLKSLYAAELVSYGSVVKANDTIYIQITQKVPASYFFSFTPPTGYQFKPGSGKVTNIPPEASLDPSAPGENSATLYSVTINVPPGFNTIFNASFEGILVPIAKGKKGTVEEVPWYAETENGYKSLSIEDDCIIWTNTTKTGPLETTFNALYVGSNPQAQASWSITPDTDDLTTTASGDSFTVSTNENTTIDTVGAYYIEVQKDGLEDQANLYVVDVNVYMLDDDDEEVDEETEEDPGVTIKAGELKDLFISVDTGGATGGTITLSADDGITIYDADGDELTDLTWNSSETLPDLKVSAEKEGSVVLTYTCYHGTEFTDTVKIIPEPTVWVKLEIGSPVNDRRDPDKGAYGVWNEEFGEWYDPATKSRGGGSSSHFYRVGIFLFKLPDGVVMQDARAAWRAYGQPNNDGPLGICDQDDDPLPSIEDKYSDWHALYYVAPHNTLDERVLFVDGGKMNVPDGHTKSNAATGTFVEGDGADKLVVFVHSFGFSGCARDTAFGTHAGENSFPLTGHDTFSPTIELTTEYDATQAEPDEEVDLNITIEKVWFPMREFLGMGPLTKAKIHEPSGVREFDLSEVTTIEPTSFAPVASVAEGTVTAKVKTPEQAPEDDDNIRQTLVIEVENGLGQSGWATFDVVMTAGADGKWSVSVPKDGIRNTPKPSFQWGVPRILPIAAAGDTNKTDYPDDSEVRDITLAAIGGGGLVKGGVMTAEVISSELEDGTISKTVDFIQDDDRGDFHIEKAEIDFFEDNGLSKEIPYPWGKEPPSPGIVEEDTFRSGYLSHSDDFHTPEFIMVDPNYVPESYPQQAKDQIVEEIHPGATGIFNEDRDTGYNDTANHLFMSAEGNHMVYSGGFLDGNTCAVSGVDLIVDSDNDAGFDDPDTTEPEFDDFRAQDAIEATSNGKKVELNTNDLDKDSIPDYADGYSLEGTGDDGAKLKNVRFVPMKIKLVGPLDENGSEYLKFTYDESDPNIKAVEGQFVLPYHGSLRLWKKDAGEERTLEDFISSGEEIPASDLGFDEETREVTVYIEAVKKGAMPYCRIIAEKKIGSTWARDVVNVKPVPPLPYMIVDSNHDKKWDASDRPYKLGIMLAGYGETNHPDLHERIKVVIKHNGASGKYTVSPHQNSYVKLSTNPIMDTLKDSLTFTLPKDADNKGDIAFWVQCYADEILTLDLVEGEVAANAGDGTGDDDDDDEEIEVIATVTFARLSNGLGVPDAIAASESFAGGNATVNLMNGNLCFSAVARSYEGPAMSPDVSISYNHLDGLKTALGRGWRTNYHMQILWDIYDRNHDGKLTFADCQKDDLLALIDETGTRWYFKYQPEEGKFISEEKTGLIKAEVTIDTSEEAEWFFQLVRHDNSFYHFNKDGYLTDIKNLGGEKIKVALTGNKEATSASDEYGRTVTFSELGSKDNFNGYELANWKFEYEDKPGYGATRPDLKRLSKITVENDDNTRYAKFTHGASSIAWELVYEFLAKDLNKVCEIKLPKVKEGAANEEKEYKIEFWYRESWLEHMSSSANVEVERPYSFSRKYNIAVNSNAISGDVSESNIFTTKYILDPKLRRHKKIRRGDFVQDFEFDDKGYTQKVSIDGGTTETWTYDKFGMDGAWLLKTHVLDGDEKESPGGTTTYTYVTEDNKSRGKVKTIEDPCNDVTTFNYNTQTGFLSSREKTAYKKNGAKREWKVEDNNKFGQIKELKSPEGRTTKTEYYDTETGLPKSTTDMWGVTTQFEYDFDNKGRLTKTTFPNKTTVTTKYDALGNAVEIIDRLGVKSETKYDSFGRPVLQKNTKSETDGLLETEALNDIKTVYQKSTGTRPFLPDVGTDNGKTDVPVSLLQVETFADKRLISKKRFNAAGQLHDVTVKRVLKKGKSPVDCTTDYFYTKEGWLKSVVDPMGYAVKNSVITQAGWVKEVTDKEGNKTTTDYYKNGRVKSIEDADGRVTTFTYDACGRVLRKTNPQGGITVNEYYTDGNIKSISPMIVLVNEEESYANPDEFTYDRDGLLKTSKNRLGLVSVTTINLKDKYTQTHIEGYEGDRFERSYINDNGELSKVESAMTEVNMEYYPNGALKVEKVRITDGRYSRSETVLDKYGRTASSKSDVDSASDNKFVTSVVYDAFGAVISSTNALGNTTTNVYDAAGDISSRYDSISTDKQPIWVMEEKDPNGNITKFRRYSDSKTSFVWQKEYDKNGRETAIINPAGVKNSINFTDAGRTHEMRVNGYVVGTYDYAKNGRELKVTTAGKNDPVITYTDQFGLTDRVEVNRKMARITTYAKGTKLPHVTFTTQSTGNGRVRCRESVKTFDKFGQLDLDVVNIAGVSTQEEDARADTDDTTGFLNVDYKYNDKGQVESLKAGSKYEKVYSYHDQTTLLKKLIEKGQGSSQRYTEFAASDYDLLGRLRSKVFDGNRNNHRVDTTYNAVGNAVSSRYRGPGENGAPPVDSTLGREIDSRGRVKKLIQDGKITAYEYDNLDQIKSVTYQGMEVRYLYDSKNQLQYFEEWANGKHMKVEMVYYDKGRDKGLLERIRFPNGWTRIYTYDEGRRVKTIKEKKEASWWSGVGSPVTPPAPEAGTETEMEYEYGTGLTSEITKTDASGNIISKMTKTYDGAGRVDKEEYSGKRDGQDVSWSRQYEYDSSGNVIGITSENIDDTTLTDSAIIYVTRLENFLYNEGDNPDQEVFPANMVKVKGEWGQDVVEDNLIGHIELPAGPVVGVSNNAILKVLPDNRLVPTLSAKFKPDVSEITGDNVLETGFSIPSYQGRYQAFIKFYEHTDQQTGVTSLRRQTAIYWLPLVYPPNDEDGNPQAPYDGEPVVLSATPGEEYAPNTEVTLNVVSRGSVMEAYVDQDTHWATTTFVRLPSIPYFNIEMRGTTDKPVIIDDVTWIESHLRAYFAMQFRRSYNEFGQLTEIAWRRTIEEEEQGAIVPIKLTIVPCAEPIAPLAKNDNRAPNGGKYGDWHINPNPQYDDYGLLKQITFGDDTHHYRYDRLKRLNKVQIGSETSYFAYYGDSGMRSIAKTGNRRTHYQYDGGNCVWMQTGPITTHYGNFGDKSIWAKRTRDGSSPDYSVFAYNREFGSESTTGYYAESGYSFADKYNYTSYGIRVGRNNDDPDHHSGYGFEGRVVDNNSGLQFTSTGIFDPRIEGTVGPSFVLMSNPYSYSEYVELNPKVIKTIPSESVPGAFSHADNITLAAEFGWSTKASEIFRSGSRSSLILAADEADRYQSAHPHGANLASMYSSYMSMYGRADSFLRGVGPAIWDGFQGIYDVQTNLVASITGWDVGTEYSSMFQRDGLLDRVQEMGGLYGSAEVIGATNIYNAFTGQRDNFINGQFYAEDLTIAGRIFEGGMGALKVYGAYTGGMGWKNSLVKAFGRGGWARNLGAGLRNRLRSLKGAPGRALTSLSDTQPIPVGGIRQLQGLADDIGDFGGGSYRRLIGEMGDKIKLRSDDMFNELARGFGYSDEVIPKIMGLHHNGMISMRSGVGARTLVHELKHVMDSRRVFYRALGGIRQSRMMPKMLRRRAHYLTELSAYRAEAQFMGLGSDWAKSAARQTVEALW